MSVEYGTLAKEVDGKVVYIYPKTLAELVEYSLTESVKDRLDAIIKEIDEMNTKFIQLIEEVNEIKKDIEETKKRVVHI